MATNRSVSLACDCICHGLNYYLSLITWESDYSSFVEGKIYNTVFNEFICNMAHIWFKIGFIVDNFNVYVDLCFRFV